MDRLRRRIRIKWSTHRCSWLLRDCNWRSSWL